MHATKLAILKATERLVAAKGFEATSLRAITTAARVNLAAVNYTSRPRTRSSSRR